MQVFTFFSHFQTSTDFALLSLSPYDPRAGQGIRIQFFFPCIRKSRVFCYHSDIAMSLLFLRTKILDKNVKFITCGGQEAADIKLPSSAF